MTARSQGRTLDRRHQEVRMHVPYVVDMVALVEPKQQQWSVCKRCVENLTASQVTVGAVHQQQGWHLIPRFVAHDGR